MSIKPDFWIRYMAENNNMISHFCYDLISKSDSCEKKVMNYELSSYGDNIRVADEFKIFTNCS
jgi:dCTP deaminase